MQHQPMGTPEPSHWPMDLWSWKPYKKKHPGLTSFPSLHKELQKNAQKQASHHPSWYSYKATVERNQQKTAGFFGLFSPPPPESRGPSDAQAALQVMLQQLLVLHSPIHKQTLRWTEILPRPWKAKRFRRFGFRPLKIRQENRLCIC